MRLLKLLLASAVVGALLIGSALPAQAAPSTRLVPLGWKVTSTKFGSYRLVETLGEAAKRSHFDYKATLKPYLTDALKVRGQICTDTIHIPLLARTGTKMNASKNIRIVISPVCAKPGMSLAAYERKYHPYTKTKILGFMAVQYDRDSFIPNKLGHSFLPHTSKISIGDSYKKVLKSYRGQLKDYTSVDYATQDENTRSGYVAVYKKVGKSVKWKQKPMYSFYIGGKGVIMLALGADDYVG